MVSPTWDRRMAAIAALAVAFAASVAVSARKQESWHGVLHEHPAVQYATRATTDRVVALARKLADGTRSLARDPQTGYLRALLEALEVPLESQLLVFSKTGVQRAHTGPHTPRALYFNRSVVVGYIPGAPSLEIAAHDPQQGIIFYTLDQSTAPATLTRQTMCLTCHVSSSTLDVPGVIARSNPVDEEGNVMPQLGGNDVTHETSHPDRWGGWFVTSEGVPAPYNQRAHEGNITFSMRGNTSSQVFIDWMNSAPETRGYLSPQSDIVSLLVFDHQMHAVNLLTRLNWEARIGESDQVATIARELADYLLFVGEVPPSVPLVALPGFATYMESTAPKDRLGRSCGQLDLDRRLMRYPCSYMVYSEAFEALPADVKQEVYRRMIERLSMDDARRAPQVRLTTADRSAVLEILRKTKADFPQ